MRQHRDIAILCTGEPLNAFLAAPVEHELYLGVNRAVEVFPCHWWVFNDHEVFTWWSPLDRPKIFSSNECYRRIVEEGSERDHRPDDYDWLFRAQITDTPPSDTKWTSFSMLQAMVLAKHLGAGEITVYGCGWRGMNDWDGQPPKQGARKEYRWQNERHRYGLVDGWLQSRGVRCTRALVEDGKELSAVG